MPAHKHAALMALYAQDAMETETPWERWEWRYPSENNWNPGFAGAGPSWSISYEYRRKPRTLNINGHEVPEPVRDRPETRTQYWVPNIHAPKELVGYLWSGDKFDYGCLKRGMVHLTKEAAEAHARALLSFTETKETA